MNETCGIESYGFVARSERYRSLKKKVSIPNRTLAVGSVTAAAGGTYTTFKNYGERVPDQWVKTISITVSDYY